MYKTFVFKVPLKLGLSLNRIATFLRFINH